MATKIYIVYYSTDGYLEKLAEQIKDGAVSVEGVDATLWQVPGTLPGEVLENLKVPIIEPQQLADADGFLFGFPTRAGDMAPQFKTFLDSTVGLWRTEQLKGKPVGLFYSTVSQAGEIGKAISKATTWMAHHGLIYLTVGDTFEAELFERERVKGLSPYGSGTYAGYVSHRLRKQEFDRAFQQGKYLASIAKKMKF